MTLQTPTASDPSSSLVNAYTIVVRDHFLHAGLNVDVEAPYQKLPGVWNQRGHFCPRRTRVPAIQTCLAIVLPHGLGYMSRGSDG